MSYIRATSNPECLYIIGTRGRHGQPIVQVFLGKQGNYSTLDIPHRTFHNACIKWRKNFEEDVTYRGMQIVGPIKCDTEWKFKISYKGKSFKCYEVTWEYVVNDVERREELYKGAKND